MKFLSFDNCGQQLKTLSKVLRWLAVIAGLILAVVGLVQSFSGYSAEAAAGIAMLIGGLTLVITGWIGSLFLHGFGIIVAANEEKTEGASASPALSQAHAIEPIFKDQPAYTRKPTNSSGWRCSRCDTMNPNHLGTCPQCGEVKPTKN